MNKLKSYMFKGRTIILVVLVFLFFLFISYHFFFIKKESFGGKCRKKGTPTENQQCCHETPADCKGVCGGNAKKDIRGTCCPPDKINCNNVCYTKIDSDGICCMSSYIGCNNKCHTLKDKNGGCCKPEELGCNNICFAGPCPPPPPPPPPPPTITAHSAGTPAPAPGPPPSSGKTCGHHADCPEKEYCNGSYCKYDDGNHRQKTGCFGKDTLIILEDKTCKKISEIKKCDKLLLGNGKTGYIKSLTVQRLNDLYAYENDGFLGSYYHDMYNMSEKEIKWVHPHEISTNIQKVDELYNLCITLEDGSLVDAGFIIKGNKSNWCAIPFNGHNIDIVDPKKTCGLPFWKKDIGIIMKHYDFIPDKNGILDMSTFKKIVDNKNETVAIGYNNNIYYVEHDEIKKMAEPTNIVNHKSFVNENNKSLPLVVC